MPFEAARNARELQMLEAMVDCAHALGMAFGEAAKVETDARRSLELFDAFQRSFLAVRMGIRLSLALRAGPKAPVEREQVERNEAPSDKAETDETETERPERGDPVERERERERDYEPVSLPRFLATLGVVAHDASRLDDLPADIRTHQLPALQQLLASAKAEAAPASDPTAGLAVRSRPPPVKAALLSSARPPAPRGSSRPRPPPPWSGFG